jgi:hypothetical protein
MKQIWIFAAILLLAFAVGAVHAGDGRRLEAELRQVVEDNLASYNREDVSATLGSIHTKSPAYASMRKALPNQFGALDTRTELKSFRYIGHDDEFAVARVMLKTAGRSGQPLAAHVMDTITVFHQEDGAWKYWSNHVLGVDLLK